MTDNRLPLLIEAAKEALMAIADVGIDRKSLTTLQGLDGPDFVWLWQRSQDTGLSLDERLEGAHKKLQEALQLYLRELGMEEEL